MHVMGIDAGGTKTVALLVDADRQIVGEGRGGGANLQVHGELEVEKTLHTVIDQALGAVGATPAAVCLALAGVDRERDGRIVRDIMRRLGFKTRTLIVNDALAALVAGAGDGPGVVVISGTGSIAYGVNAAGVAARAGGWGSVFGDEGSGYWIGRKALAAVARDADGRGPRTRLTPLVLEHLSIARPQELVAEIYDQAHGRYRIATLGETVEQARACGDAVATEILREAASELVLGTAAVVSRLGMRGDSFPTFLAGGILRGAPWLASEVTRQLAEVAPRSRVSLLEVEPAMGAVHLAFAEAKGGARVPPYLDSLSEARP